MSQKLAPGAKTKASAPIIRRDRPAAGASCTFHHPAMQLHRTLGNRKFAQLMQAGRLTHVGELLQSAQRNAAKFMPATRAAWLASTKGLDPGGVHVAQASVVAKTALSGVPAGLFVDPMSVLGPRTAAVQRKPDTPAVSGAAPTPAPPKSGVDKPGFIDNGDGSFIRTGPAESGGQKVQDAALPPATRVFVSGTHPDAAHWWYVTAFLADKSMVRGYVQDFRVTTDLPEPTARLHQVVGGDTAEKLAVKEYSTAVRDGHDLRYYENVLLYVNKQQGRAGITGAYQDPGILGGGANNVQLVAGHRIWLVSPAYAKALEAVVPDGSLTGGAVAKVKRFIGHLEDIVRSVTAAPGHFGEVAGEYAQAIRDHLPEIVGIVAGFILAEATSAFLAATPTGVGQIAAVVIQLGLAAFGAAGMVQAGIEAVKHASEWLSLAWTAKGDEKQIGAASKEFLKMLVSIAMAALSYLGVKGNFGNALKIANAMPTGGLPAFAVAGGGRIGADGAGTAVAIGPGTGSLAAAGNVKMEADKDGGGSSEKSATQAQAEAEFAKRASDVANEAPGAAETAWRDKIDLGSEQARVQAESETVYRDTFESEYVKLRQAGKTETEAMRSARQAARKATTSHAQAEGAKIAETRARTDIANDANKDGIPDAFKATDSKMTQDFADFNAGTRGATGRQIAPLLVGKTVQEMETMLKMAGGTRHPATPGTFETVVEGKISYQQVSYTYPDGTLVRLKPGGDIRNGVEPMYSVEMQTKTLTAGNPQSNVAFKLDPNGVPVPKGSSDISNPYAVDRPVQRLAYEKEILRLGHQMAKPK